MLAYKGYEAFGALCLQNATKAESQTAAERIFRLAAANGDYRIDSDNHGLHFADGASVRWHGDRLELQQNGRKSSLLSGVVKDFSAVKRGGVLTVNLAVEAVSRPQGRPLLLHEIYDYPRVGLP